MYALAPRVDVVLHVPRPSIWRIQSSFLTLRACQGNVERLKAPGEERESEFTFWKDAHPPQEADGAEQGQKLAWRAKSSEQLAQERADGASSRAACAARSRAS
jgi:hypothetical protein